MTGASLAIPVAAQVQTEVPPVIPGAKPVQVERIKIHGTALEGNLEGDAVDRDVLVLFAGTAKVRVRLRLIGNDEFVGVSNGEFRDAAGNVTHSGCGTVRGKRIKVEPLPETCQNILPPE